MLINRQTNSCSVYGKQIEPVPLLWFKIFIKVAGQTHIEVYESFIFQLHSCFSQSGFGDNSFDHFKSKDRFEKMIKLVLIRAFYQIYEKKYQGCKRKFTLADKIGWTLAVLLDKLIRIDDFLKKSDQPGTDIGNQVPCQRC